MLFFFLRTCFPQGRVLGSLFSLLRDHNSQKLILQPTLSGLQMCVCPTTHVTSVLGCSTAAHRNFALITCPHNTVRSFKISSFREWSCIPWYYKTKSPEITFTMILSLAHQSQFTPQFSLKTTSFPSALSSPPTTIFVYCNNLLPFSYLLKTILFHSN